MTPNPTDRFAKLKETNMAAYESAKAEMGNPTDQLAEWPETVTLTRGHALDIFWAGQRAGMSRCDTADAAVEADRAIARAVAASAEQIARGGG